MRNRDRTLYAGLEAQLITFNKVGHGLPGIKDPACRDIFIKQLIDSMRRIQYVIAISERDISDDRANPSSEHFDPLRASVLFKRQEMIDEAFWLTFLSIHFGKSLSSGWRLARDIYGSLEGDEHWTWERTSLNPGEFRKWLSDNYGTLKGDGIPRNFGNHRKYETLKPGSPRGTGLVVESYIDWVKPFGSHELLIRDAEEKVGKDSRAMFDYLYGSMDSVISFGRTAKFDYLTMLAKLGLVSIEPGSTYMQGSTGPVKGARLLFSGNANAGINCRDLESLLVDFEGNLSIGPIGMQVLEDALCNWQKSPQEYKLFQG